MASYPLPSTHVHSPTLMMPKGRDLRSWESQWNPLTTGPRGKEGLQPSAGLGPFLVSVEGGLQKLGKGFYFNLSSSEPGILFSRQDGSSLNQNK